MTYLMIQRKKFVLSYCKN